MDAELLEHASSVSRTLEVRVLMESMLGLIETSSAMTDALQLERRNAALARHNEALASKLAKAEEALRSREQGDAALRAQLREQRNSFATELLALSVTLKEAKALRGRTEEQEKQILALSGARRGAFTGNQGAGAVVDVAYKRSFGAMDDRTLMCIFSFLEVKSVLSAAQMNKAFLRKVNTLFGMQSSVSNGDAPHAPPLTPGPATEAPGRGANGDGPATPVRAAAPGAAAGTDLGPATAAARAAAIPAPSGAMGGKKLAKAVADKLNPAELKGIIALMTRVRNLEALVQALEADGAELLAREREGEELRNALMGKLADAEAELKHRHDLHAATETQARSDAEVINFLDARVRELERELQEAADERGRRERRGEEELRRLREERRAMQDLLEHTRDAHAAGEEEARRTRRLLVKEVKGLRQQVVAVQAGRDQYRSELAELRARVAGAGM